VYASPAVAGDLLYLGSCSGRIYALDKTTGEEVWTHDTDGDSFHGDPLITDSLVIMPSDDRSYDNSVASIYAFERSGGRLIWQYDFTERTGLGTGATTDLVRHSNTVIAVTTADRLVCLDIETGALLWDYQSDYDPGERYWTSTPAVVDSAVIFGSLDGHVRSLHVRTGDVLWEATLTDRVTTSILAVGDLVYCGCADGTLTMLDVRTGRIVAQPRLEGSPIRAMLRVQVGDDTLVACVLQALHDESMGGYSLVAVHAADGDMRWYVDAEPDAPWSIKQAYEYQGYILAGRSDGVVRLLDPGSGEVVVSFRLGGEIRSVGVDGDMLYIGTIEGTVYGVSVSH